MGGLPIGGVCFEVKKYHIMQCVCFAQFMRNIAYVGSSINRQVGGKIYFYIHICLMGFFGWIKSPLECVFAQGEVDCSLCIYQMVP